jgi:hypothetical protein
MGCFLKRIRRDSRDEEGIREGYLSYPFFIP